MSEVDNTSFNLLRFHGKAISVTYRTSSRNTSTRNRPREGNTEVGVTCWGSSQFSTGNYTLFVCCHEKDGNRRHTLLLAKVRRRSKFSTFVPPYFSLYPKDLTAFTTLELARNRRVSLFEFHHHERQNILKERP